MPPPSLSFSPFLSFSLVPFFFPRWWSFCTSKFHAHHRWWFRNCEGNTPREETNEAAVFARLSPGPDSRGENTVSFLIGARASRHCVPRLSRSYGNCGRRGHRFRCLANLLRQLTSPRTTLSSRMSVRWNVSRRNVAVYRVLVGSRDFGILGDSIRGILRRTVSCSIS